MGKLAHLDEKLSRYHGILTQTEKGDKPESLVKAMQDYVAKMVTDALAQISEEIRLAHSVLTDEIVNKDAALATQINDLKVDLKKIPIHFPEPKETDLSDIIKAIPDVGPQLAQLEKKIEKQKREFVFDVERETFSNLIKRIVVKEV